MSFQPDEHTGHRLGKYELLCRMAVGGMAEIFLGFGRAGPEAGKAVALKRMLMEHDDDTEALELLLQEAKLMAGLKHPNAVRVLDLEVTQGNVCLVMEFIPGLNLEELAGYFHEPLPLRLTLAIIRGAALGLNHAHNYCDETGKSAPIIHRDVTPRNIILGLDGKSKVLDFGIARIVGAQRRTAAGMVRGTSSYMSPEQATDQPLDIRTDIFSLGVVFHELLTGERLFARGKPLQDMMAVFQGAISLPSQANRKLPRSIDSLVLRMLERSLEKRFQTMGSFVAELDKAFATMTWTEADCLKFMQKHFSKRRHEIEAMLSRIDVSIAPAALVQRRPFEDAQTVIESRSSNKGKPSLKKGFDPDATAVIDQHKIPVEVFSKPEDVSAPVSSSDQAVFQLRTDDFAEEEDEKTLCSQLSPLAEPKEATASKELAAPKAKDKTASIQNKKEGSLTIRWLILGIILIGFASGLGWWCGHRGYVRQLVENRNPDASKWVPPSLEDKHSDENVDKDEDIDKIEALIQAP